MWDISTNPIYDHNWTISLMEPQDDQDVLSITDEFHYIRIKVNLNYIY